MGSIGATLTPTLGMSMRFAEMLVKDIPAGEFARVPQGIRMNSPAFCFGHLAVYPERMLEMVGRGDLAQPDQRYVDLFSAGKECVDDPTGTVYPSMGEILERFRVRHGVVREVLPDIEDSVFARTNPNERLREWLPTVGAMIGFLVSGHAMSHLGQVSAWRRIKGLPSVM